MAAPGSNAESRGGSPPNFLIIFADDLGIDQLEVYDGENRYGSNPYPYACTPVIDSLAQDGCRFQQARAYSLCSPSRSGLQSGQYALRHGVSYIVAKDPDSRSPAPTEFAPSRPTLAKLVKSHALGYKTAFVGKLHLHLDRPLGAAPTPTTIATGARYATQGLKYDMFRGIARNPSSRPSPRSDLAFAHPTWPGWRAHVDARRDLTDFLNYHWIVAGPGSLPPTTIDVLQSSPTDESTYLTAVQVRASQNWLGNHQNDPFLLLWCPNDIHVPLSVPPKSSGVPNAPDFHGFLPGDPEVPSLSDTNVFFNTRGRSKVEHLDAAIGDLLDALTPAVRARTYVIVMGDNGTPRPFAQKSNPIFDSNGAQTNVEPPYPGIHPKYDPNQPAGFTMAPYEENRLKGSAYEGGVRVPLIVTGPGIAARTSNALVDVTDIYETIDELIRTATGTPYVAPGADSISFASLLAGGADAAHARKFSHSGRSIPNGFTNEVLGNPASPGAPELAPVPGTMITTVLEQEAYYLRVDDDGRIWKLVRRVREATPATGAPYGEALADEMYELTSDRDEAFDLLLPVNHGANPGGYVLVQIRQEYDRLLTDYAALMQ